MAHRPDMCGQGTEGAHRSEATRHYQDDTLILETNWSTGTGQARVIDFMPPRDTRPPVIVRIVEGVAGSVEMDCTMRIRFGYGQVLPWVRRREGSINAIAGPDAVWLDTPIALTGRNMAHQATFTVEAGERVPFVSLGSPRTRVRPSRSMPTRRTRQLQQFWLDWVSAPPTTGVYREAVVRSLITLKALTYQPTGGIVAAATTSLPEDIGGVRNWDYRYCWLRDATITLEALLRTGYTQEAPPGGRHWAGR